MKAHQVVVFIHGLRDSPDAWQHQIDELLARFQGVSVEIPDLTSDRTMARTSSLATASADVLAELDRRGIQRAHLCGLSLGAMIAVDVGREAINEAIAREIGIGPSDLACLHEVIVDGPLPAGELARRLRLTTGAITHMIDRLAEARLVRRTRDRGDRRRVLIEAVPEARERMLDPYRHLDAQTRATLAHVTAGEREVVARFIERSLGDTRALLDETP